jgi:hypothetical protein
MSCPVCCANCRLQRSRPQGIFLVLSGLVRVEVVRGSRQETQFVGVGGCVGFVSSLLGKDLPAGVGVAAAYGQVRIPCTTNIVPEALMVGPDDGSQGAAGSSCCQCC